MMNLACICLSVLLAAGAAAYFFWPRPPRYITYGDRELLLLEDVAPSTLDPTAFSMEGKEENSITQTIHLTLPKAKKAKKKTQKKANQQTDQGSAAVTQTEGKDTP